MKDELLNLKTYYHTLLEKDVKDINYGIETFFLQWGELYGKTDKPKVLFIGKAMNGWVSGNVRSVDDLFNEKNGYCIFNRGDQLEWVENLAGAKSGYNTRKSQFWSLIREFSKELFKENDWYKYVAWTNLYKISPEEWNPDSELKDLQLKTCTELLKREIEILKPSHVIFLTSDWERNFLKSLGISDIEWKYEPWDPDPNKCPYKSRYAISNGVTYIRSLHPQGKKIGMHSDALLNIVDPIPKAEGS